jgi:hypothetical protein
LPYRSADRDGSTRDRSTFFSSFVLAAVEQVISGRKRLAHLVERKAAEKKQRLVYFNFALGAGPPEFIQPRGHRAFTGKVAVAVSHWSESMAEGVAIADA